MFLPYPGVFHAKYQSNGRVIFVILSSCQGSCEEEKKELGMITHIEHPRGLSFR